MGLLRTLFAADGAPNRRPPDPVDDYWYEPYEGAGRSGTSSPLSISTVYRGVSVLANTVAMLPLPLLERLSDDRGWRRAPEHRLYRVLHDAPNRWQTSFSWRQMMMGHLVLRGNAYGRIVSDQRGFAAEIIPLHPDRVSIVDQLASGQLVYRYASPTGAAARLVGGETLLHLRGFSSDGFTGVSVLTLMRRAVDTAINTETFAQRFFSRAPMMRGFLKHPRRLEDEARKKLEESFQRANAGPSGWHRVPVLEGGLEWESVGVSNEDSQFIQTREFSVPEFARFLGVPTVLLMHADKTSLYANAEQFFLAFARIDLEHWLVGIEQALTEALLLDEERDRYRIAFTREGLMRGDAQARSAYYRTMVELGILTRNEVRRLEGRNALPGLDEPLMPANMRQGEAASAAAAMSPANERSKRILTAAARRLASKEVLALRRAAERHAADAGAWREAVTTFYARYRGDLVEALALDVGRAAAYCARREAEILAGGAAVLDGWTSDAGGALAAVAEEDDTDGTSN